MATNLALALADGACLIESDNYAAVPDLKSSLEHRLTRYYTRVGTGSFPPFASLQKIQLITAIEALSVIRRVQHALEMATSNDITDSDNQFLLIGTRDLAELRTLLSIIFKWGIDPLMVKVVSALLGENPLGGPRVIELDTSLEDYTLLSSMSSHLVDLLFPSESFTTVSETLISASLLNRHLTDLLRPCITLGWLPKSLISDSTPPLDAVRPRIMQLLTLLPPPQIISAIGSILSSSPIPLAHTRKICSTLLSQQLLRPQGIRGLCAAIFGEGEFSTDETPIEKLEHVVRVLTTVPSTLSFLAPMEPAVHKRVASFSISRMLSNDGTFKHQHIASPIILNILHHPFQDNHLESEPSFNSNPLYRLITLISNTDPSPVFISALLTAIFPCLYSVLYNMDQAKTSDPNLKESLRGILITWGKIVDKSEGCVSLWSILGSGEALWKLDLDGQIRKYERSEKSSGLTLITPGDFRQVKEVNELSLDANILDLYPDPVHFARFLKDIDRTEISSEIFVKLLEAYRSYKVVEEENPMRTLLYLQIIIEMQTQMPDAKSFKPAHLLAFVKHVLEPPPAQPPEPLILRSNTQVRSLQNDFDLEDPSDSDDDTPDSEIISADTEMMETCINLLLSILEANNDMSARTMPVLNEIFSFLEPLARDGAATIKTLAREARMVMTARLASTSTRPFTRGAAEDSAEGVYQKALKLLQDPILPVRAHGLLLLRQLVSPSHKLEEKTKSEIHVLVPAILSIFLQSIHDDDSYVFLNGIQGLAGMVETFGKDVLQGLMKEYTEGLAGMRGSNLTQHDVDSKIRIGEALALAIRRCGEMLGIYVDLLVPPFSIIVKSRYLPNTLRASSLSLLAECESTNPSAMLPYILDLAETMIDLLQVESTSSTIKDSKEEFEPTSDNAKLPPLRRAALHLLSLVFREATRTIYDSPFGRSVFSNSLVKRAKTTLTYIASTDKDIVIQVMARETGEIVSQMQNAMMGI
ncbi:hypothetical protein BDZ94DRAFT_1366131 [Collybia nuda]|uniref:RNA polymerase II assembly factor Rtp1 C-terminal domain-containing protein n=1 Tax=Collybia nuda TaxID=64659 RepID=A0A9P5Y3H2_9AGAR|nr:hypothetical protein BDZ94DRAFT_1366131 [Collybia nuda]